MNKNRKYAVLLAVVLLVIAALAVLIVRRTRAEVIETAGQAIHREQEITELTYNGKSYPLNRNVETYLLVGLDSDEEKTPEDSKRFYNHIQSDVIVLLAVDRQNKTVKVIQLNRDTMCDVPWLDVIGQYGGTEFEQLALSYNSGSGGLDSLHNTGNAVSSLLFNVPVDHCLALTIPGIAVLNDLVGGVTVTIKDDMRQVDKAFEKGSTVTLKGEQAEKFLRARMILTDDTNASRMARHRDYLDGFIKSAETAASRPDFAASTAEKLDKYMITDMTAQQMNELVQCVTDFGISSVAYPEGELRLKEHYEFYPDPDSLWNVVSNVFCA